MTGLTITRLTITPTRSGMRWRAMAEADNGDTYERLASSRQELADDLRAEFDIDATDYCEVCGHASDDHDRRAEDGECFACPPTGRVSCFDRSVCAFCGYVESASGYASADTAHDSLCCGLPNVPSRDCPYRYGAERRPCVSHEERDGARAVLIVRLPIPLSSI